MAVAGQRVPVFYWLGHLHVPGHHQDRQAQAAPLVRKTPAEGRQAVVIGVASGGNEAAGHRMAGRPLRLAGGENSLGVAIGGSRQLSLLSVTMTSYMADLGGLDGHHASCPRGR